MTKQLKFHSLFLTENLLVITGFALLILLGCQFTGVARGADNLFTTYYGMYPFMYLLIVFILSFGWCTTSLNLALSYGCRRRDYFWGLHLQFLVYIVFGWLMNRFLLAAPAILGWHNDILDLLTMFDFPLPFYALLGAAVQLFGCVLGPLYMRSKLIGSILMVCVIFIGIGLTVGMMLTAFDSFPFLQFPPYLLSALLVVICVASEVFLVRFLRKATVR